MFTGSVYVQPYPKLMPAGRFLTDTSRVFKVKMDFKFKTCCPWLSNEPRD